MPMVQHVLISKCVRITVLCIYTFCLLLTTVLLELFRISTVQSLYTGNAMFVIHRNGLCYKKTMLKRDNFKWSFSNNSFVKFHDEKIWES